MEIYSLTETLSSDKKTDMSSGVHCVEAMSSGVHCVEAMSSGVHCVEAMSSGVHCVEAMSKYTVGLSLYLSLKLRSSVTDMVSTAWRLASLIT